MVKFYKILFLLIIASQSIDAKSKNILNINYIKTKPYIFALPSITYSNNKQKIKSTNSYSPLYIGVEFTPLKTLSDPYKSSSNIIFDSFYTPKIGFGFEFFEDFIYVKSYLFYSQIIANANSISDYKGGGVDLNFKFLKILGIFPKYNYSYGEFDGNLNGKAYKHSGGVGTYIGGIELYINYSYEKWSYDSSSYTNFKASLGRVVFGFDGRF